MGNLPQMHSLKKREPFGGSLLIQVTGLAILISSVILGVLGWQLTRMQDKVLERNQRTSLERSAEWLARSLEVPLFNFEDEVVETLSSSMLLQQDIEEILISANDREYHFRSPMPENMRKEDRIILRFPIVHKEYDLGFVEVYGSVLPLQKSKRSAAIVIIIQIFLVDLFLVVAIVFFLSHRFIKPVKMIQDAASRIAEGSLDSTIHLGVKNELGSLACNLEQMRITLLDKIGALRKEIAEKKKAEYELDVAKKYIDEIIRSMPSVLIAVDGNCLVTHCNKKAEELGQRPSDKVIGQNFAELFPDYHDIVTTIVYAMQSGTTETIRARESAGKEGKKEYTDIIVYPLDVQAKGAVVIIDDVTMQHRLQEELNHSRKLDAIGQLAGGISHDFNNMLGGILGGAELLAMHCASDEKAKKYIDLILHAGRRVSELNRKLLAFSRRGPVESFPVDMAQVVTACVDILLHSLDKRIQIRTDIRTKETYVTGDFSQLQNALLNLGINSGQAIEESGDICFSLDRVVFDEISCKISSFSLEEGAYLDIEVRDTGGGIARENLSKIFDPFYTTKTPGKGTGLGLASVYGTVIQHHGAITVYSEIGIGTTFHIYLPLLRQPHHETEAPNDTIVYGQGRILLVDDEEVVRHTAGTMLEKLGYDVIMAENGIQAISHFKENAATIDLVLLDMIMPEMNGRECFLSLREIRKDLPVLLASGFSEKEDVEELFEKGLKAFLRKPYTTSELSRAVALALQKPQH